MTAFTQMVADPELKDVLDLWLKEAMLGINCHGIATVQEINFTAQTLNATMNYTKTYYQRSADGIYSPVSVAYPILVDCPFVILGGGTGTVTFPITKGDQCLILFNDRDIDNWFASSGGNSGNPATNRLHSFSDGIALVGLKMNVGSYDNTRVVIKHGNAEVGLGDSKITIKNDTKNLYTILHNLLSAIATAVSSTGDTGIVTIATAAGTADTAIGGLLE